MNYFSYPLTIVQINTFEEPQISFPNQNPRPQTIEPTPHIFNCRVPPWDIVATGHVHKLAKTLYNWYRDMPLAAIQNGGPGPSNQSLDQETQVNPTQVPATVTVRDPDVLNQHQLPLPDPPATTAAPPVTAPPVATPYIDSMRDIIRQELLCLAPTLMITQAPPVQNNAMMSPVSQPSVSAVLLQTSANAFFPAQLAQPLISLPSQPPPLMPSGVHGYQARPVPAASAPIPGPANQAFTHQASSVSPQPHGFYPPQNAVEQPPQIVPTYSALVVPG